MAATGSPGTADRGHGHFHQVAGARNRALGATRYRAAWKASRKRWNPPASIASRIRAISHW